MKKYEKHCKNFISELFYIESNDDNSNIVELITNLKLKGLKKINLIEFDDNWLKKRLDSILSLIHISEPTRPSLI